MTLADYLRGVKSFRDDYSEEIPQTILHSTSQEGGPRFKVRKAWFQLVGGALAEGIRDGYLSPEWMERYRTFYERNKATGFHDRDTRRDDIDYANRILDDIIAQLSQL